MFEDEAHTPATAAMVSDGGRPPERADVPPQEPLNANRTRATGAVSSGSAVGQSTAPVAVQVAYMSGQNSVNGAEKHFPMRVVACLLAVIGFLAIVLAFQWRNAQSPYSDLRSFAITEATNNDLRDIGDLTVDGMQLYAQATCVQASTAEEVRFALRRQLKSIPEEAREDIISSAVIDGQSTSNSMQNTSAGIAKSGLAFSYLAYWSTAYTPSAVLTATYSSCVMATGVEIEVGEEVAEWRTTRDKILVANEPCHCGRVWCEHCPVFETRESRTPIFKRHKLSLRNQADLHRWMVRQAVDRVSSLIGNPRVGLEAVAGKRDSVSILPSIGWTAPSSSSFLGSDRSQANTGGNKNDVDAAGREEL